MVIRGACLLWLRVSGQNAEYEQYVGRTELEKKGGGGLSGGRKGDGRVQTGENLLRHPGPRHSRYVWVRRGGEHPIEKINDGGEPAAASWKNGPIVQGKKGDLG